MMTFKKILQTTTIFAVSFALVETNFAQNANAGMISTSNVVANMSREKNKETVNSFMNRADVQNEFKKRGVSASEASARVAALSDVELQQLAGNIENAPAGADVVVISLTTILLVVLILFIIGRI